MSKTDLYRDQEEKLDPVFLFIQMDKKKRKKGLIKYYVSGII